MIQEKIIFLKRYLGLRKSSFDIPNERILTRGLFFTANLEKKRKTFSRETLFLKMFLQKCKKQFWQTRRITFDKKTKLSRSMFEKVFQSFFLQNNFLLMLLMSLRMTFFNLTKIFCQNEIARRFSMNVRKSWLINFFWKVFFSKVSKRTCKKQFSKPYQKIFAKRPNILRSKCDNDWEVYFFPKKFFSLSCVYGQVECSFDNPEQFSTTGRKRFVQFPKRLKKYKLLISFISFFPKNVLMDT